MSVSGHWLALHDDPGNPLLEPPRLEWMIADPTVVPPEEAPDDRWHLFANSLRGIQHFRSDDGYAWGRPRFLFRGLRPCVRRVAGRYYLFYERFLSLRRTSVSARISDDLSDWSPPVDLLRPDLPWEGRLWRTNGNPCLVEAGDRFLLYYSAGSVWLPDCFFVEPRHIGLATADDVLGPYTKRPEPLFGPSPDDPWRNMGAGSIKVFRDGDGFVGLNNGIYRDEDGRSRSAVWLLESRDGVAWSPVRDEPILAPEPSGWKRALVYALDVAFTEGECRVYYNARDGWFRGRERIGVAVARVD